MIHILFTGGTISMRHDAARGGNLPRHGGDELLALAGVPEDIPRRTEDWARMPACHLDPPKLFALRARVLELACAPEVTGVVITHGTDVLEETAYLLARTVGGDKPIVLTGAMRTADHPAWDGAPNLRDAIRVAAAPESAGRGAMVVFGGGILDGRDAVKLHANDPAAFAAPHASPLGKVRDGRVRYLRPSAPRTLLDPPSLAARVAEVPVVVGDDGGLLDAARARADGVVVTAFGSGNVPPGTVPAIRAWLDAGKPVVLASRCAFGEVVPAYAFDGGGAGLVRLGAIPAGARSPSQARMELLIALSAGAAYGAGT
jgi:L-asparaginase